MKCKNCGEIIIGYPAGRGKPTGWIHEFAERKCSPLAFPRESAVLYAEPRNGRKPDEKDLRKHLNARGR